jgi:hypothetical protein
VINRRRAPRAVANNCAGILRVLEDVEIEQVIDQTITVLSETRVPRGERMILWAPVDDGDHVPLQVRAVQRQALLTSPHARHRVRFAVDAADPVPVATTRGASRTSDTARIGGIARDVPVRLLELSVGGCLLESPVRIAEGTVGWLSVNGQHTEHDEIVRVCRSESRPGRFWPWVAAVEFLTLEPPSAASLRRSVALFTTSGVETHERT